MRKLVFTAMIFAISMMSFKNVGLRWGTIEDGLRQTEIDNSIWIFEIDPAKFRFSGKYEKFGENGLRRQTLPEWGKGINLGMFKYGIPDGYAKIDGVELNSKFDANNAFLVWDDNNFAILDRYQDGLDVLKEYPNVVQNIRMIKFNDVKRNRWQKDNKIWSVSTIATTTDGKVLLIHSRRPYNMHGFINQLLEYDDQLHIYRMAYLEGGPESSIHITDHFSRMGSYETGFNENNENYDFWVLPFALTFDRK